MKLIDKSAVVAEIEKWRDGIKKGIFSIPLTGSDKACATFEYEILGKIKDFLDTLEVKEVDTEQLDKLLNWWKEVTTDYSAYKMKEVNLEKEIEKYLSTYWSKEKELHPFLGHVAKHFYELGLKAQKGEKV